MDGSFIKATSLPTGWTHIVLNYIGPNNEEGIRIYENGIQTGSDDTQSAHAYQPGEGRVVIGRQYTDVDAAYASVDIDELLFFNETLSDQDIRDLNK